jgi:hypothetical protein
MNIIPDLQILYALIGAAYNIFSIARVRLGRVPLSATNPNFGLVVMAVVAAITLSQPYFDGWVYLLGWAGLVVMLARGPVTAHFKAISQGRKIEQYSSPQAAWLAFLINLFGLIMGCIGIVLTIAGLAT